MERKSQKFIPLGNTGVVCFLDESLSRLSRNQTSEKLIQSIHLLKKKGIGVLVFTENFELPADSTLLTLFKNGFKTENLTLTASKKDLASQAELTLEFSKLSTNKNILLLYKSEERRDVFRFLAKVIISLTPESEIEEVLSFFGWDKNSEEKKILESFANFLNSEAYIYKTIISKRSSAIAVDDQEPEKAESTLIFNLASFEKPLPVNSVSLVESGAPIIFNLTSLSEEKSDNSKDTSFEETHTQSLSALGAFAPEETMTIENISNENDDSIIKENKTFSTYIDDLLMSSVINIDTLPIEDTDEMEALKEKHKQEKQESVAKEKVEDKKRPNISSQLAEIKKKLSPEEQPSNKLKFEDLFGDELGLNTNEKYPTVKAEIPEELIGKKNTGFNITKLDSLIVDDMDSDFSLEHETEASLPEIDKKNSTGSEDFVSPESKLTDAAIPELPEIEDLGIEELEPESLSIENDLSIDPSLTFIERSINDVLNSETNIKVPAIEQENKAQPENKKEDKKNTTLPKGFQAIMLDSEDE